MNKPMIKADNGERQRALSPATCSAATSSIYFLRNGTWYLDCFNVLPEEVMAVIQSTYHRERRLPGFEGIKAEPDKPCLATINPPNV